MKKQLLFFYFSFIFKYFFSRNQLDLIKIDESKFLLDGIVSEKEI